ncbi:MAG: metallophosphoesterase [Hyphomicrobiaceae bacterium]
MPLKWGHRKALSRRSVLKGVSALVGGTAGMSGYAAAEHQTLKTTRYRIAPKGWPKGLVLRLAVLADLHVCEPWMGIGRVGNIVRQTNRLGADAILLLGDYQEGAGIRRFSRRVPDAEWAAVLGRLEAPLGVHAVLGNHDWWDDERAMHLRRGPTRTRLLLEEHGIPVYENDAVRLIKDDQPFWLAGLGDQWAFMRWHRTLRASAFTHADGIADLPGTLARIDDDAPVIMMAHEPDIFARMPARVALTISGHTHGGQVRPFGLMPVVPSAFGSRYAYGHIVEDDRHLVVSGGLGFSGLPLRFGVPPEIVVVEVGDWSPAALS